jgi:hypothetical protein
MTMMMTMKTKENKRIKKRRLKAGRLRVILPTTM